MEFLKSRKTWLPIMVVACFAITIGAIAMTDKLTPITGVWRYRMTVTVDTPEGVKTGSAVREVDVTLEPRPGYTPYPYHPVVKVKGEAVVVDLGKRGVLFTLLGTDDYQIVFNVFPGPPGLTPQGVLYYRSLKNAKAPLTKQYPMFVKFRDIKNPMTVEAIYPVKDSAALHALGDGPEKDFEDSFGQGVKFKEITIEMTDEPITWKIENVLPWLPNVAMTYLDGTHHSRNSPLGLAGGNFIEGEK